MRDFFDNKMSIIILLLTIPLLFLPKINLVSIGDETAGVRVDDFILLFVGMFFMLSHMLSQRRLEKIEGWILLVTFFSLISFFTNRFLVSSHILYMDAKIFYAVRLLEYFLFFYVGSIASKYMEEGVVIRLFFLWNLLLMLLQKFNIAGAITVSGYTGDVSTRVQGIASFPSEMGLILNLLFAYMIFDKKTSRFMQLITSPILKQFIRRSYLYWMFGLFGVLVIFTGNRISIVALIICFLFRLKQEISWRSMAPVIVLVVLSPLLFFGGESIIKKSVGVYERSADLFSWNNLKLIEFVWDKIDLSVTTVGNEMGSSANYDMSWWIRAHKWIHTIKSYALNPECYLQGLGPGFASAALDGGFVRVLTENGLIGVFLYWKFFQSLYKIDLKTKWMVIAFLINMIFFDAYLAYKAMSLLLFTSGFLYKSKAKVSKKQKEMEMLNQAQALII